VISDPDPEDIFAQMAGQLADISVPDEQKVTDMATLQLADRLSEIDHELVDRKELLNPTTQEARDLHSLRGAIIVEMKKRGVL
jgi:hypothetical protein